MARIFVPLSFFSFFPQGGQAQKMQRNEESDEFASSVRASAAQINEGPRPPVRARCQQAPRTQNQHALGSAARSGDVVEAG